MTGGTILLLAAVLAAQEPHSRPRTSAVQQLELDGSATAPVSGETRELICRGKPGIEMRIHQEPSPRDPDLVTMMLRYERLKEERSVGQEGMGLVDYGRSVQFIPGSCTWNSGGFADIPPEPLVVYFDLPRDAQTWAAAGARDTSVEVAAHYPDVATLPRFLSDSSRYWVFYVDDASNVAISFGRWPLGGAAPAIPPGSVQNTTGGGAPRDGATSTTRSSTRTASRDSAVRLPTPARIPAPAGSVGGPLRDTPRATATPSGPLPTGSEARRGARVRTPTDSTPDLPDYAAASIPGIAARRISHVRVGPGPQGVSITFRAITGYVNPTSGIVGWISPERPTWDERTRQWSYPAWHAFWSAEARSVGGGEFVIEPTYQLDAGRRYHYLIQVPGKDESSSPDQRTGSFIPDFRTPINGLFSK